MKNIRLTFFVLILLSFSVCKAQVNDGVTFNKEYVIGPVLKLDEFMRLNKNELRQDSIYNQYDKAMDTLKVADSIQKLNSVFRKKDFPNNRSRIFADTYNNGKMETKDSTFSLGLSTPCDCYTTQDTMFVKMGLGFFGGFGFNIEVVKNNFQSCFFEYIDDVKPYKYNLEDTATYNFIIAKSKYQFLTLDKLPEFKPGQQLTGSLTYTTENYYAQSAGDKYNAIYVTGKLFFTCKIRERTQFDALMERKR